MTIWIIATLVAFFVKGLCGFANTLVFTSILGFGVANVNISPVELMIGFPPNIIQVVKNRKRLKKNIFLPLILLVLAGSIPGAVLLKNVDVSLLKAIFGVVVVLIGIEMLVREYGQKKARESKVILTVIGLVSGVLCGLFGIGAPMAAYVSRVSRDSDEFKANIGMVFMVENIVRLLIYGIFGVLTLEALKQAAVLMPFVIVGMFAGMKSAKVLNEKTVKVLVIVLLIVSGAVLTVKSL